MPWREFVLHSLLEQQLRAVFGDTIPEDEKLRQLFEAVSRQYDTWGMTGTRAEDGLADLSQEALLSLVRIASDAHSLIRVKADGTFEREWHSAGFEKLFGTSHDELSPNDWQTNIHPEDRAAFARLRTVLYTKQPTEAVLRARMGSGEFRWLRVSVHPDGVREDGDERYVFAFKDVHNMKSSIQEKETSNAMMRAILNSTVDGIEVVERGGNLISYNTTFIQLWRLPSRWGKEPSLQKRLEPMAHQTRNPEHFMTRIHEIMARGAGLQYDIIELKDERVFERYATPYTGSDERHGIVWSYRDLTERRQTQSTLSMRLRYEKALSECSSILFSHPTLRDALDSVLEIILKASRVSRVYIMENVEDERYGLCVNMTHEAVTEGVTPQRENPMLRRFPLRQGFDRWADVLSEGGIIHGRVEDFPESEHEALKMQDIMSLLVLPLYREGKWHGLIGFDDTEHERVWGEEDIRLLRTLADMIGVHIEGQKREIQQKEYEFTTMPLPPGDSVSATLWSEFGITVFRINHEGIFSHVEGEGRPFGTALLGKHYSHALSPYLSEVRKAWENGHVVFLADRQEPHREVVMRLSKDADGRRVLDGGMRIMFEEDDGSKYRREIIGIVSHELRTPLSSILGALKLLDSGAAGEVSNEARSLMEIAHNNGLRLLRLLNDIIDVEKIEAQTLEFDLDSYDLLDVAREAVELNEAYAAQFDITLRFESTEEQALATIDRSRIIQVLTNLISNAVKFSPPRAEVLVRVLSTGVHFRLEVQDRGPGIPKDFQPKIFEKFSHLDPDRERTRAGAGLGLSICKAIVDRHEGEIGFTTEEGNGSVFYVVLKAGQPPA